MGKIRTFYFINGNKFAKDYYRCVKRALELRVDIDFSEEISRVRMDKLTWCVMYSLKY